MRPIAGTKREVELLEPVVCTWDDEFGERSLTVPMGFQHDGPSIPSRLRGVVPYTHAKLLASVVHDWLYVARVKGWTRADADALFLASLKAQGVGWFTRQVMHKAVRVGGSW